MDHFNATVKDGKLVKTRRGLQVSRQKFNGLSFVNVSPQEVPQPGPSGATGLPNPAQQEIIFVEEGSESGRETPEAHKETGQTTSGADQGSKRRQRATARRGKSPAASRAATPRQPSPKLPSPRFDQLNFQLRNLATNPEFLQIPPNPHSPAATFSTAAAPEPDSPLSDEDWVLFKRYFENTPRSAYPYEDILTYNPARSADFYNTVTGDMASVHCVLMCGRIVEAINTGTEPNGLSYHISKICAILNRKLNQEYAADAVTLNCIARLAWIGCYVGRLDHWHLHMCGLRKVLDLKGGTAGLADCLLAEMYKADLKGATALASTPYLPFTRRHNPISATLPPEVCNRTLNSLTTLLYPLHINPDIISTLVALSTFASAIRLARESPGTMAFDPHVFTEEWQAITHSLLTRPQPLRAVQCPLQCRSDDANPYSIGSTNTTSATSSPTESYMSNHRLLPTAHIVPTTPTGPAGHLDPALRIAALLYLKELLPDWPRNLGGYAVLLTLLRHHMSEIIRRYAGSGNILTSESHNRTATPGLNPSLIDPLLTATTTVKAPETHRRTEPTQTATPSQTTLHLLKPLLLLLCLIGDTVSRIADANESRLADEERYPRAVYRDCLREVVGLVREEDIDEMKEEDLAFVRLFELGMVLGSGGGGEEQVAGGGWNERAALKRVVSGGD